ncbi:SIMPL domain-containing protein [Allobranchiibius sp. GilTou73]|uniref:SIMPL domain-containing protein n=1 Tax=Allobranchiibius sp. GilTou73 TaxID=2904523 RepID=UPI001F407D22|nr:SIMPL domain-containing protein [Allobranchiibius sp. GilTou73]UIJ33417.1 SIMPL domain-containing protein [Allobranchiibius sp. GilTou73]
MALTIRVHETATKHCPAERADLQLRIEAEGADKHAVAERVRAVLRLITDQLADLERNGAVGRWSNEQMTTWSERPYGHDGERLTLTHRTSADVQARFADFGQLGHAVEQWCEIDEVRLEHVQWELTTATRNEASKALRAQAVRSADEHAHQYARAAGKQAVEAVSIADSESSAGGYEPRMEAMAAVVGGHSAELRFAPRRIAVSIAIDVEFQAH